VSGSWVARLLAGRSSGGGTSAHGAESFSELGAGTRAAPRAGTPSGRRASRRDPSRPGRHGRGAAPHPVGHSLPSLLDAHGPTCLEVSVAEQHFLMPSGEASHASRHRCWRSSLDRLPLWIMRVDLVRGHEELVDSIRPCSRSRCTSGQPFGRKRRSDGEDRDAHLVPVLGPVFPHELGELVGRRAYSSRHAPQSVRTRRWWP